MQVHPLGFSIGAFAVGQTTVVMRAVMPSDGDGTRMVLVVQPKPEIDELAIVKILHLHAGEMMHSTDVMIPADAFTAYSPEIQHRWLSTIGIARHFVKDDVIEITLERSRERAGSAIQVHGVLFVQI